MKKMAMTIIIILALATAAAIFLNRHRQAVGVEQLGVVVSPGGRIAVYHPGDRPLVIPGLQHFLLLSAKPLSYLLTDANSVVVSSVDKKPVTVGCLVRYQVEDPAKLVARQGFKAPQAAIEALIKNQVVGALNNTLQRGSVSLDDTQTRIILVGSVHEALRLALEPSGIKILDFDLISW